MPYKIAIASGKGGTGKTTVSVNLFHYIWKYLTESIQLIDCDVEEPNDAIFFQNTEIVFNKDIFQLVPEINTEVCTYCRKCAEYCEFNAISIIPSIKFSEVNATLCHSCGACSVACKFGAITEQTEQIGNIKHYNLGIGEGLAEGILKIGSPMQTILIKELKKETLSSADVVIYDAPPGTSCPVVETVADADYTILVTEPTPFGLNDLKLAVQLLQEIEKPFGVIINKAGLGNSDVHNYLKENQIQLLGEIPFKKEYAGQYAAGELMKNIPPEIEICYLQIINQLKKRIGL